VEKNMNYYEILKISRNANQEQIKDAYKKQVKKYHPDLYIGDKDFAEKKLKEINEAYNVLSDLEMKLEYDKYLQEKYQENVSKNVSNSAPNAKQTTQNYSTTNSKKQTWTLSDFIIKKINKLDSKKQTRIFFIVLITISILLLINLIEIKQYFDSSEINTTSSNQIKNEFSQDLNKSQNENSSVYKNTDTNDIDNMIYDFLKKYEESFYNSI